MSQHRRPDDANGVCCVLFVCTGNICRSPFAEILTRHLLVGRLGGRLASSFVVSSAGVHAVVGAQMHTESRGELAPWGLDRAIAGRFTARQLSPELVAEAHLVLGATPWHRSAVVQTNPQGLPTTFSLREFARLAQAVDRSELPEQPVQRAHRLTELARRQRGLVRPLSPDDDEVPDPMGRSVHEHQRAAMLIREAVSSIVDIIAPVGPTVGPVRRPNAQLAAGRPPRQSRSASDQPEPVPTAQHPPPHPPSLHVG